MADGLEEPGWPASLTPKHSPGETFASAFAQAAGINLRKQALEKELAQMQMNMQLKQEDHALDLEKFAWQQKYQTAALNRQYGAEERMAAYQDRMATVAEKRVGFEMDKNNTSLTHADDLLGSLSDIANDPETPMGSPAWWNKAISTRSQYPYTKETEKVWKQFSIDANRNAIGLNRDANMLMRSLQTSLQQGHSPGSDPFDIGDLQRDPTEWRSGKNAQGEPTKFIADIKIPDPNDPAKFRYEAIDRTTEKKMIDEGNAGQIRYRTTPASNYNNWMDTYKHVQRLGSGRNADQAVTIPEASTSSEVIRSTSDGRKAVFDSATKQFIRWAE